MIPQQNYQRPLALMHLCNECALFSVRRQPPLTNGLLQQTLIVSAPPFCSNDIDSSSSSPSPFSSPASNSADSSPETSSLSSPKPAPIRHRSHSECIERSPVKSILKRRPMFRSLSECEEDGYSMMKRYDRQSLEDVSESDSQTFDDAIDGSTPSLNDGFKKKSVSFSERVEENFFRPGSSILGQRKKNQRKAKGRKRRESTDSAAMSSEENEVIDHRRHSIDIVPKQSIADISSTTTVPTSTSTTSPSLITTTVTTTSTKTVPTAKMTVPTRMSTDNEIIPPLTIAQNDTAAVIVEQTKLKKNKDSKNSRKKCKERKSPPANQILGDDRYKGFVIGVQRRTSTDSALSATSTDDDDNDNENDFVVINNGVDHRRRPASSSFELKDSGIDDEMEELCAQMTAAVVSA